MRELLEDVRKLSEDLAISHGEAKLTTDNLLTDYEHTVEIRMLIKQREYIEDKWRDALNHAEETSPYAIKDASEITDEDLEIADKLYEEVDMLSEIAQRFNKEIRKHDEWLATFGIELPDDFY